MSVVHNPPEAMKPAGAYSLGIEVKPGGRLLFISGQVGVDSAGRCGIGILEQSQLAWANLGAVLASAGMKPQNVVKITTFYARELQMNEAMRTAVTDIRLRFFGSHRPASTALYVDRLMKPEWLIEIEAVAIEG